MPTLTSGSSYTADITLTKQENTVLTLPTTRKYVDRNIQFTFDVQGANATLASTASSEVLTDAPVGAGTNIDGAIGTKTTTEPSSGYFIIVQSTGTGTFTVTSPGWINSGEISPASGTEKAYYPVTAAESNVSGTNTVTPSASVSGTNATLGNIDNGISVTATGGGSASASIQANVSTAGYVPVGAIASGTISGNTSTTTNTMFISGVTLNAPSEGTRTFSVTVPNGDNDTLTYTFTVDASGNTTIE